MDTEKSREVEFDLREEDDPGFMDYDSVEEYMHFHKKRRGVFHGWTETKKRFGIVEDLEDGQVYNVEPARMKFLN